MGVVLVSCLSTNLLASVPGSFPIISASQCLTDLVGSFIHFGQLNMEKLVRNPQRGWQSDQSISLRAVFRDQLQIPHKFSINLGSAASAIGS